ncbi:hypothetical protein FQA39_LY11727 [Lamprigera yunnana]|nr:hypothetical protein FQA39_LY11727 [Lamprigera yunnana]
MTRTISFTVTYLVLTLYSIENNVVPAHPTTTSTTIATTSKPSMVKQCIKEENPNPAHLYRLREGIFINDSKLKCFIKCAVIKLNEMTKTGILLVDNIRKKITLKVSEDQKIRVIQFCNYGNKTDLCNFAFRAFKCISENIGNIYN